MSAGALAAQVRERLAECADPERAVGAQAYLKSTMPCLGVRVPQVREIALAAAADHPPADLADLRASVEELWDGAVYREERNAGQALLRLPLARGRLELVDLHRKLVTTGAWWDFTDDTAHRIADLLEAHPDAARALVLAWSKDADLWLRRLAIISQLGRHRRTDTALLTAVIEQNLADPEFFVAKAIGWALRDYGRTDPAWVVGFVETHPLRPLSAREALKRIATG